MKSPRCQYSEKGHIMKLPHRRRFLHLAAGAAALPAISRSAWAQAYPSKTLHWIVGLPAGGIVDILARIVGQWVSERLGQQFIVENRTGAAGNLATEAVVRAPLMAIRFSCASPNMRLIHLSTSSITILSAI
jgi:tripartite-type tricarboxylate transporter receptor subunit TctC